MCSPEALLIQIWSFSSRRISKCDQQNCFLSKIWTLEPIVLPYFILKIVFSSNLNEFCQFWLKMCQIDHKSSKDVQSSYRLDYQSNFESLFCFDLIEINKMFQYLTPCYMKHYPISQQKLVMNKILNDMSRKPQNCMSQWSNQLTNRKKNVNYSFHDTTSFCNHINVYHINYMHLSDYNLYDVGNWTQKCKVMHVLVINRLFILLISPKKGPIWMCKMCIISFRIDYSYLVTFFVDAQWR